MKHIHNVVASLLFAAPDAPVGGGPQPPKNAKKVNRFDAIFPVARVVFKANVQDPGKPWNNGVISQTLADAAIPVGETGAFITSARIVRLTMPNGGGVKIDLQLPSSGVTYKRPMIDASEDEEAKSALIEYRKLVADRWISERTAAVKAGTASNIKGVSAQQGVNATDELLKELGLKD